MVPKYKIALQVDYPGKPDRYYSLRLKQALTNEPPEYSQPRRIYVLANMEGNFHNFTRQLLKRKIINKYLQWIFDEGHLVILGDCFAQDSQATECLWLIYSLEEQARRAGGYVHFILSNYKNLEGKWRSSHPKYADKQPGTNLPITALYHGNNELWHWLRTKNTVEKIGHLLFVPGGISPALNTLPHSLAEINQLTRSHFNETGHSFPDTGLILFNGVDNPLNYEDYNNGTVHENDVNATLLKFGVSTIITGSTATDQIISYFDGKVINMPTRQVNGMSEGLLIRKRQFYRITVKGEKEQIA